MTAANAKAGFALRGRNPDVLTCIANLSNDEVFTPPEFANRMLDTLAEAWASANGGENIWSNPEVTFLDPVTKTGIFLREITARLIGGLDAANEETQLVDAAVAWLNGSLPSGWIAERSSLNVSGPNGREGTTIDPVINLRGANSTVNFVVDAKQSITPRNVQELMAGLSRTLRPLASTPVLVVAPWLSARTQELLRREEMNYVDLTGNAWIRADYPALFIRTVGATRNPAPAEREVARLRGVKAGRLVRALVDVAPPYGVRELAKAIGLTAGYVSRLLDALDREALIDRSRKGEVVVVDYPPLLRRWVETYDVLKSNEARRYIAPEGPRSALARLSSLSSPSQVAVTGSFAAGRIAPVAAPALLLAYATDVAATADALNLLPADEGANVILLRPYDEAVWSRLDSDDDIAFVAPSQTVADCLTGTGRMPAEGDALLAWMVENEGSWRAPSLRDAIEERLKCRAEASPKGRRTRVGKSSKV